MPKILIVDDEQIITKTLKKLLEREGYAVVAVNSGQEAIQKVEEEDFQLIITDVRMPDMDGIETVRKIEDNLRAKPQGRKPVIFITGYADEASQTRADELGYKDYIYKPFDLSAFLQRVKAALQAQ